MKQFPIASLLAVLSIWQPALAAGPPDDDAAAFGAQDAAFAAALSADGKQAVFVGPGQAASTVAVLADLESGTSRQVAWADAAPLSLTSCDWSAADRLVCSMDGLDRIQSVLLPEHRAMAVDLQGGKPLRLGERNTLDQIWIRPNDGEVVDFLNGTDGSVLMARITVPEMNAGHILARNEEGLGVVRIDTRSGAATQVERPANDAYRYLSDGRGNIRIMTTQIRNQYSGLLRGENHHFYRARDERNWRELGTDTFDGDGRGGGTYPLAVDSGINAAYVLERLEGRWALYRIFLEGRPKKKELVFAAPHVDVHDVVRVGRQGRVIGARYVTDVARVEYFDPAYQLLAASLAKALPKLPLISFESASADENVLLVHATSAVEPGRWYVYDRTTRKLGEAIVDRPRLENRTLSPVKAISYPAADGTQITAWLTLPPGVSEPNSLPAIVIPHGGPAVRDEWGFDWRAQFFAQRGFVVLETNYRGSEGYGDDWYMPDGFRSWKTSIGDVCDAGRWLVKQGIADPSKLATFGWSYGGYAALQANVLDPDLYKAVVAVAPMTDLAMLKLRATQYTNFMLMKDFVGSGPHVTEGSPAQNAGVFKAPVLLFAGDKDLNVDIAHARKMNKALRDAGKWSQVVVYTKLDHELRDNDARADLLRRSEKFLKTQLRLGTP